MNRKSRTIAPRAIDESRRRLLGGAVGLGAAGVGLAALGAQAAGRSTPEAVENRSESGDIGYHETDHIRRYYRSAW